MITAQLDFEKEFPSLEELVYPGDKTYDSRIKQFNRWFFRKKIDGSLIIRPKHIREFFKEIERTKKSSTVEHYKNALRASYRVRCTDKSELALVMEFFRTIRTARPEKKLRLERVLDENEISRLRYTPLLPYKARLMIQLCVKHGLRRAELCNIRLRDCIEFDGRVKISILGKGKKIRSIFPDKEIIEDIKNTFCGKEFLFETREGTPVDPNQFYRWSRLAGDVLKRRMSPHDLRHTFATLLLKKGASLKAVANYLGHASTSTTNDYVQDSLDVSKYWDK